MTKEIDLNQTMDIGTQLKDAIRDKMVICRDAEIAKRKEVKRLRLVLLSLGVTANRIDLIVGDIVSDIASKLPYGCRNRSG